MAERHFLNFDAFHPVQGIDEADDLFFTAGGFKNNQTRNRTVVGIRLMQTQACSDVASEFGEYFLDIRYLMNPVVHMNSDNGVGLFCHLFPFSPIHLISYRR